MTLFPVPKIFICENSHWTISSGAIVVRRLDYGPQEYFADFRLKPQEVLLYITPRMLRSSPKDLLDELFQTFNLWNIKLGAT